jgi:membrane protein implicated in regulation of membrane protease activity
MLDLGIDVDAWPWVWLAVAFIFALIEITILGGSFVLLPFAISALLASVLGFYDVSIEAQWMVFVIGGGILWLLFYQWAKTFLRDNVVAPGVGAERLVGMTGIITKAVVPDDTDRSGRVSVGGEVWGVSNTADVALPEGTKVLVTAMQGTRLVVELVDASNSGQGEQTP